MPTLNCQSAETAYESLSEILGASIGQIEEAIRSIDLESECSTANFDGNPNHKLWDRLLAKLTGSWRPAEEVRWFHLTRSLPGTAFSEGLLPLSGSLSVVWGMFDQVFAGTAHAGPLHEMRAGGVASFQYQLKVGKDYLAGPYAMLVRESAFRAKEMGNHDYLRIPEIVEDICHGYKDQYGEDLLPALEAALVPCIVTFRSRRFVDVHAQAATRYLYDLEHQERLTMWSNHVFDGRNQAVPFSDILSVEYL